MQLLRDIDVKGKTVLVRVDYNVPIENGKITSNLRLKASVPTIHHLIDHGALRIILISHLGRPEGKRQDDLSLEIVTQELANLVGRPIRFISECIGEDVTAGINTMAEGGIALLENLRFYTGEDINDMEFATQIVEATGATVFVQDAFSVLHRKAASTVALTQILKPCAGLLVEKELAELSAVMEVPERPLVVMVGGLKVEDKAPLIEKFQGKADRILVGGKIAADGYETKADNIYVAEDFLEQGGQKLDIGEKSVAKFMTELGTARTVIWNGNLGRTEESGFETSSEEIAEFLGQSSAKTVILGGDTTGFVYNLIQKNPSLRYDLLSTGGSASLKFLAGEELPGLAVLA